MIDPFNTKKGLALNKALKLCEPTSSSYSRFRVDLVTPVPTFAEILEASYTIFD